MKDYLCVGLNRNTGSFHGCLYRYHPTPSGSDRWILSQSTTKGFKTERAAASAINKAFPNLEPIDLTQCSGKVVTLQGLSIPARSEITVIEPKIGRSHTTAENEKSVEVRLKGKLLNIKPSFADIQFLMLTGRIEIDSCSGNDPELSAIYTHYKATPAAAKARSISALTPIN